MSSACEPGVVLVTGAAGGLGRALVETFAGAGWRVAAASHSTVPLSEDPRVRWQSVDVTRRESVMAWVEGVERSWGRLDVLINNAGRVADAPLPRLEDADWDGVMDVNLKGAFFCSQAVLPTMTRQGSGLILNIASFAARGGGRGQANYAAAKAGLMGLTLSLAKEVGRQGIRVNAVMPGVMRTGMTQSLPDEVLASFAAANQLGRLNEPRRVAEGVLAIARMQDVSGQVFPLDSRVGRWA